MKTTPNRLRDAAIRVMPAFRLTLVPAAGARALVAAFFGACVAAGAADPTPVTTVLPERNAQATRYEIPGRTEPIEQASVFTRATGIVKERRFDIGDRVSRGAILAVIDVPEIDRQVDSAQAALEQAESRTNNARQIAARADGLLDARAISREDYDLRITTAQTAEAALRVAKAELARVKQLQEFATVTAPFDGVITARNFDVGDRVRGDSATSEGWLYRLSRMDTLRFVVGAAPDLALRVVPESGAKVRFNELPGREFPAKLYRTSGLFDVSSGTMRVECLIENPDLALPAGLPGTAVFELPAAGDSFTLPNNTLVVRQGRPLVAIVKAGKVAFLDVVPGRNTGPRLEVRSAGLTPDTQVIVNPNALLREGDAVLANPAASPK